MLHNTFHHIPGIGLKTEETLWDSGINNWNDFKAPYKCKIAEKKALMIENYLSLSREHLHGEDPAFFEKLLPSSLHWRMFPEFRDHAVYLDIETTGLEEWDSITTIALYDGKNIRHYVQGKNLDQFVDDIANYKLIISYNGKSFDQPAIERHFGITLPHAHIDLRYVLASLGFKGGLKRCERAMGIDRGDLDGVDGYFAVILWSEYEKKGNPKALETLLAYNIEDVVNLETLMLRSYNLKIKGTPFEGSHNLKEGPCPEIPFKPHMETVERLRTTNCYQ